MAGLDGLNKNDKRKNVDVTALDKAVLENSPMVTTVPAQSNAVFKRYNFSLTVGVSARINEFTTIEPLTTRSDIVKAGILAFEMLSDEEQLKMLSLVKK